MAKTDYFNRYFGYYITALAVILLILSLLSFTKFGEENEFAFEFLILTITILFIVEVIYNGLRARNKIKFLESSYFDILTLLPFEYLFGLVFRLPFFSALIKTTPEALALEVEVIDEAKEAYQRVKSQYSRFRRIYEEFKLKFREYKLIAKRVVILSLKEAKVVKRIPRLFRVVRVSFLAKRKHEKANLLKLMKSKKR